MCDDINIQIILTRKVHNNRSRLLLTYSNKVNRLFKTWWLPKVKKGKSLVLKEDSCVFRDLQDTINLLPLTPFDQKKREKNG